MLKKMLILLVTLVVIIGVSGCGEEKVEENNKEEKVAPKIVTQSVTGDVLRLDEFSVPIWGHFTIENIPLEVIILNNQERTKILVYDSRIQVGDEVNITYIPQNSIKHGKVIDWIMGYAGTSMTGAIHPNELIEDIDGIAKGYTIVRRNYEIDSLNSSK